MGFGSSDGRQKVGQTWSFRGSKSRNKVSVGEPAEGSSSLRQNLTVRKLLPSNNSVNRTNQKGGGRHGVLKWVDGHIDLEAEISPHFAIARPLEFFNFILNVWLYFLLHKSNNNWLITFNGGSLGSCIDEERSQLRYVVWIAEFSESSNLWTQMALLAIPGACLSECWLTKRHWGVAFAIANPSLQVQHVRRCCADKA